MPIVVMERQTESICAKAVTSLWPAAAREPMSAWPVECEAWLAVERKPRRKRRFPWLAAGVVIILAVLYLLAGLPLRHARSLWREGKDAEAVTTLEKWRSLSPRKGPFDQMLAIVHLGGGKREEAKAYLNAIKGRPPSRFPVVPKLEVAEKFVSLGRYQEFVDYDAAFKDRAEPAAVALYRAAANLGINRLTEAQAAIGSVPKGSVDPKQYAYVDEAIRNRKRGKFPLLFDRAGKAIASFDLRSKDLLPSSGFEGLIDRQAGVLTIERALAQLGTSNALETTLDTDVQRAAVAALNGYRGSLVAIDVETNEILAVANTAGKGTLENLAFQGSYEPGSVIKVLTSLNAIDSGVDLSKVFPLDCRGFLVLNKRQFFDWAKHDSVPDLEEALAISCNVAYAEMGLKIGPQRLKSFMNRLGFDHEADLGFFKVPLGKTLGGLPHEYATASFAVGLEFVRVNSLHIAILADMVASRGTLTTPRLLKARRSILGNEVLFPYDPAQKQVVQAGTAALVTRAMKTVVTNPRGTGRRAAIPGLSIAMKTGTAGDAANGGYDSVILAFAPADAPRIAIGMIAENSGPAERAGAEITKAFFSGVMGLMSVDRGPLTVER